MHKGVKAVIQGFSLRAETSQRANVMQRGERRKVYRYKVALPLRVCVQNSSGTTDWITVETRNFSAWSVYFLAPETLAWGTKLILTLFVPHGTSEDGPLVFRMRARVVRSEDVYESGGHFAGLAAEIQNLA